MTIDDYSPLFAIIRTIRDYSLFATIRYSLFGFSRHPYRSEIVKQLLKQFISFCLDRINFWDFGGHADYDEIRVELYGQTQVKVSF